MNVQVVITEIFLGDVELFCTRLRVGISRLRRLAHHVAELAGQNKISLAFHAQRFDEKHVTADSSPRETGCDSDLVFLQYFFRNDLRRAEKLVHALQRNSDSAFVTFGNLARHFSTDLADLAFELAQSGFLRVLL